MKSGKVSFTKIQKLNFLANVCFIWTYKRRGMCFSKYSLDIRGPTLNVKYTSNILTKGKILICVFARNLCPVQRKICFNGK